MKNKILISVLIILILILCFNSYIVFKQNKQLKSLEIQLSEQERVIAGLKQEKNNITFDAGIHPIEKAVQDCMQKEDYTTAGMSKCVDDSINDWYKEIDKYLLLLKDTLPEDKYKLLQISQERWEEYKNAQWHLLEAALGEKAGTIYINILSGDKADVVEKRAKDLSGFYFELTD